MASTERKCNSLEQQRREFFGVVAFALIAACVYWCSNLANESVQLGAQTAGNIQLVSAVDDRTSHVGHAFLADRSSVSTISKSKIRAISHNIDRLAAEQNGGALSALTSDPEFLRRIYLDVAGRIPTYAEVKRFLDSKSESKREDLIDELLESDAFASHQFNYWADLLRVQSRNRIGPDRPYIDYIKDSLARNKPYDQFVKSMLTATGPLMKRGNGAVGYFLRDYGMPEDSMSNTIRVFLGTRLECAQCHNHPTDKWTQRQYFEMVAFHGGVHFELSKTESKFDKEIQAMIADDSLSARMKTAIRQIAVPLRYGISGTGMGVSRLPEGYQYRDGDEYDVVHAKTMFDGESITQAELPEAISKPLEGMTPQQRQHYVRGAKQIGSRDAFANWLVSDNERFPMVIANRMWKFAMGTAVVEPVDNITSETIETTPPLLKFLTDTIVELNYDNKQYLRAILWSKAYQQKTQMTAPQTNATQAATSQTPIMRRMSAEQIWDSLLTLTINNVDHKSDPNSPVRNYLGLHNVYDSYDRLIKLTPDEIKELAETTIEKANADPSQPKHIFRIDGLPAKFRIDYIHEMLTGDELVRASELMSPMPPGHFLREFGQSDRDQIENSNKEISISQLLSLMNGFVEQRIIGNPDSAMMQNVAESPIVKEQIDVAYLSVLCRYPTEEERSMWVDDVKEYGDDVADDLVWTLLNSTEFLFVR